jgi:hypothetical protein
MDGRDPELVLNDDVVAMAAPSPGYIELAAKRELREIERRRELYRDGKPMIDIAGRTVIVVDDGIATGGTVRAVLRGLARRRPRRLVLAVPVAPGDTLAELSSDADEIVCLSRPATFMSVGSHYRNLGRGGDRTPTAGGVGSTPLRAHALLGRPLYSDLGRATRDRAGRNAGPLVLRPAECFHGIPHRCSPRGIGRRHQRMMVQSGAALRPDPPVRVGSGGRRAGNGAVGPAHSNATAQRPFPV